MAKSALVTSWVLYTLIISNPNTCMGDVDSGCPSWGCLPWGSFSLSGGIPSVNSTAHWRTSVETALAPSDDVRVPRGCVSDQQSLVCTTQSGYVSIDPTNGKKSWNYITKSPPYLPVMDVYGDIIGMDAHALYYVGANGIPQQPIAVANLKPMYSLMIGNDTIALLTGSTNKTAQIVTYLTDGIVDGSVFLRGSINRMTGTFIPCSQPIIAGFRAYVMTYFAPDDTNSMEARRVTGMLRLYAVDILHGMASRLVVAWYFNFGKWTTIGRTSTSFSHNVKWHPNQGSLDPIVTYFGGNVYVNVPGNLGDGQKEQSCEERPTQPYPGSLWAIRDDGDGSSLLFKTSCFYGPMAVYDTYSKPLYRSGLNAGRNDRRSEDHDDEGHVLWIMNRSPAMIQGYNALTGSVKKISGFDTIFQELEGWITSSLSVSRSTTSPANDQLVFGISNASGKASISVIEVSGNQAKLVMSWSVGGESPQSPSGGMAIVEGQIVNFAFHPSIRSSGKRAGPNVSNGKVETDTWTLGLAAMIKEYNSTSISRAVVGIF